MQELHETPLADTLRESEARWGEFAGWRMPLEFAGVSVEVEAVRRRTGLFDVSHMGEIEVRGTGAAAFLDGLFTADATGLAPGRARYALLLDEDGGILEDLLIYRLAAENFLLVVNAANAGRDLEILHDHAPAGAARVEDNSGDYALLALQGPQATFILADVAGPEIDSVRPFGFFTGELAGVKVLFSRTGYTGEDGWEIFCRPEAAGRLWELLASVPDVTPCGLAARDVLRLEAALPLYGHELTPAVTPLMAGLERFLRWEKGFRGRDALARQVREGVPARLAGLEMTERAVPRPDYRVLLEGREAGMVTSGTFSPTLGRGIAMAYLPPGASPGMQAELEVRGRPHPARLVKLPFYRKEEGIAHTTGQEVHSTARVGSPPG